MSGKRQMIPIAGLLMTVAIAGYMVVRIDGQESAVTGDFTTATMAEVRDAQGVIVLRGQFVMVDEEDDDVERQATLEPTGADQDATGEAEVEFSREAPAVQEVEFSVENLEPGAALTFLIDGNDVATATVDRRGRAEVELDVRIPGTSASR